jgi:multidrug resistance protein
MSFDNVEKLPASPETLCGPPSSEKIGKEKGVEEHFDSRSIHSGRSGHSIVADLHDVENADDVLARTVTPKRPIVKVSRAQRRGLFARFSLTAEVTDPYDYKDSTKWLITFVVAVAAAAAPVGSAIILRMSSRAAILPNNVVLSRLATLDEVARTLHTDATTTNLSVALYMLSMAIFPLWWSAFSETLGRRTIYLTSFAFFILFSVLSAISHSISMLIAVRLFAGGAAASVQAVGAGTIADIWESRERGRAMGIFYLGPLCGPLLAPIVGGILGQAWNWRATQWALVIYGGKLEAAMGQRAHLRVSL